MLNALKTVKIITNDSKYFQSVFLVLKKRTGTRTGGTGTGTGTLVSEFLCRAEMRSSPPFKNTIK
jgi:hypothetical protein